MRGGVKIYRGSAAGARAYLEAERGRADDYYLGEGNGTAERLSATRDGGVDRLGHLEGAAYEAWVAGYDPETGVARGRIRSDGNAVRFAEFVVNGPKSWSLVAELHPDIAEAYEKAQDVAAREIVGWFAQHGTTRVGPRGGQVAVPVERIEAAVIRHYTSRAGDPHRHLHLQINARVEAAGKWRGLDTVAVRNSISAVQGIGHAAIAADPGFRQALAAHGYTLDPVTGELEQMADFVGTFSKRAEQITRQIDGYERAWRKENPGREPGPGLFRSWDARAWADARPDKPKDAQLPGPEQARHDWTAELADLGFTSPVGPVALPAVRVGEVDRDAAAARVLARLTATRSAWNVFDLRGQAELLVAEAGVIADGPIRAGLAADITARAYAQCVNLLDGREGLPDHVRAWTSPQAVETEKDLEGRFAVRGAVIGHDADLPSVAEAADRAGVRLDTGQTAAVAAMAGGHALVVVHGAAGAGKTTTLTAARELVAARGASLMVVTPTLKAARTAQRETHAEAGSAAWLAYEHGYRWNNDGLWTRLESGQSDPVTGHPYRGPSEKAQLTAGDLLVVDEAGMLDQDTARALLHIADHHNTRIVLMGDPHQLPAVGRGGVLDLAARWSASVSTLDVVHRFIHNREVAPGIDGTVTDTEYAALSLRMRTGDNPGAVFDALQQRGQVVIYPDEAARTEAIATEAASAWASGTRYALSADTREKTAELSAAVRQRLVSAGHVDDTVVVVTSAGERIGRGDLIATRRNDRTAGVANRDIWKVQGIGEDGSLTLAGDAGTCTISGDYAREHTELAYASTVYGVQGDTVQAGHLVLGDSTTAQAAYVGMTRGRRSNTVHIVAGDLAEARRQWVDTAQRDRADLGLRTARDQAHQAASQYASSEQVAEQQSTLADRLHTAWNTQAKHQGEVRQLTDAIAQSRAHARWLTDRDHRLTQLRNDAEHARQHVDQLTPAAQHAQAVIEQCRRQLETELLAQWRRDQPALDAAMAVRREPTPTGATARITGKTARHQDQRQQAEATITAWESRWGQFMPKRATDPGYFIRPQAEQIARQQLPDAVTAITSAEEARDKSEQAVKALRETQDLYEAADLASAHRHRYQARDLPRYETSLEQAQQRLSAVNKQITTLTSHPLANEQWLTQQRQQWTTQREQAARARAREQARIAANSRSRSYDPSPSRDRGYGIGD